MTTETKKIPSQLTGKVRSSSGEKSITVVVETLVKHPLYGKFVKQNTKLAVHDPAGDAKVGDVVEIVPCRPISKTKRWRLLRIVKSENAS